MTLRSSRSAVTVFIALACGFVWFAGNAAAATITVNATVEGTIKDSDGAPIGVFDTLQPGGEPAGVPSVERNLIGLGEPTRAPGRPRVRRLGHSRWLRDHRRPAGLG